MVPHSVANETKLLHRHSLSGGRAETQTENKTLTWYLACHNLQAACHFTLIEKCLLQLTQPPPISSSSQLSTKQDASRKIQLPGCLCVCIYFSYLNVRQAVLHIVPTGLSALIADQKPQKSFLWKGKDKTNRSPPLCCYSTFSNRECNKSHYCVCGTLTCFLTPRKA